jgi:hypothetical protein
VTVGLPSLRMAGPENWEPGTGNVPIEPEPAV